MEDIFLYNTLTRKKEKFRPLKEGEVKIYSCGPTVYDYAHIGNLRTFLFADILRRTFEYNDYRVKQAMNITDVGHLTDDADAGEDKIEVAAKKKKKTAGEIAAFFEKAFLKDIKALNIEKPNKLPRATEHIAEMIELIKKLEKKGYTYKISDGIYFDTSKFKNYSKIAHQNLEEQEEGARIRRNPEKNNSHDFALWKFSPQSAKRRQMEWDSPWGLGFPGWHIECSAMSEKYLGVPFDVHTGGVDHIGTHHTNEIAQSEAANEKEFARYFMHGGYLVVDGKKMSKSKGNFFTLADIKKKGFSPLDFRYLCLQTHYKKKLNFTWKSLKSAKEGYAKIKELYLKTEGRSDYAPKLDDLKNKFKASINNDLNTAEAISILFKVLRIGTDEAKKLVLNFDRILGLSFEDINERKISKKIQRLLEEREKSRKEKDFKKADKMRKEIEKKGYKVEDTEKGPEISPE